MPPKGTKKNAKKDEFDLKEATEKQFEEEVAPSVKKAGNKKKGNAGTDDANKPDRASHTGGAGVILVGTSDVASQSPSTSNRKTSLSRHNVPAILYGGRAYSRRNEYLYCDFGGCVDRGETAVQGAAREFVEELLGVDEKDTSEKTVKLINRVAFLIEQNEMHPEGGFLLDKKGTYTTFLLRAESVVQILREEEFFGSETSARDSSPLDFLFHIVGKNHELRSLALISIDAVLANLDEDNTMKEEMQTLAVRDVAGGDVTFNNTVKLRFPGNLDGDVRQALKDHALAVKRQSKNLGTGGNKSAGSGKRAATAPAPAV